MPKKIDIRTVDAVTGKHLLMKRRAKADEYQRRKAAILARNKAWREANPDKCVSDWPKRNPARKAATTRASYERNRDQVLARQAERERQLADSIVRRRFVQGSGLQSRDVLDALVPVIRMNILIKRELKAKK